MTIREFTRFALMACMSIALLIAHSPSAYAAESVQIYDVYPSVPVDPGSPVTFSTSIQGFTDPVYAVADSFSASGATTGSIDVVGNYLWTPGIYDAGRHTVTVTVTDYLGHTASTSVNITVSSKVALITGLSPGSAIAATRPITFTVVTPGFTAPSYAIYDSVIGSSVNSSLINSSGVFTWAPTIDDLGAHTLTVVASDIYGHTAQVNQNITVINPTVSIISLKPGSAAGVGSAVSFVANGNMLTNPVYSISDSFNGTSTVTTANINSAGLFTWKPTASDLGMHTLTITVADVAGNSASLSMQIFINTDPATTDAPTAITPTTTANNTAPSVTTPKKYLFTTTLSVGSRGTAVTELQKRLIALGLLSGQASGYFGTLTSVAVKKFQKNHNLAQVGFVGPGTRKVLNQ